MFTPLRNKAAGAGVAFVAENRAGNMNLTNIRDSGEALLTSLTAALGVFFAAIPRVIGFILILIIGWLIASLAAKAIAAVLRKVRFDSLAERSGLSGFVTGIGLNTDASGFIALVVKWFIRLIALVVAFDALGLPAVSEVLQGFLLWLPNLIVGIVVLVIGGLIANALSGLVRGTTMQAGFSNPGLLAAVARVAVWAFAIVVAVNQIGIATELVNTLFMAVVGAVALAAGLAFGLGGRDTASKLVERWYDSVQEAKPKLEQATTIADSRLADQVPSSTQPRPSS